MVKSLRIKNIKSFEDAELSLENFTLLLGANASGKSNIRDILRFLHGASRGYKLVEVLGGKWEGGDRVWSGVRGGPNEFLKKSAESQYGEITVQASEENTAYTLELFSSPWEQPVIWAESLYAGGEKLFGHSVYEPLGHAPKDKFSFQLLQWLLPGVIEVIGGEPPAVALRFVERLGNLSFLDLAPNSLREPSYPGPLALGDTGENLSTVLYNLIQEDKKEADILDWLRELTPMDAAALEFDKDARGRISLTIVEHNGVRTSAESASDGTLRFLAYLALLLSAKSPSLCFIEELETGIHPGRLRLLVELFETQTKSKPIQILATSHSPSLLNLLSEESLHQAQLIYRREGAASSNILPLSGLPQFADILQRRTPGDLFESSWFETTIESIEEQELHQ